MSDQNTEALGSPAEPEPEGPNFTDATSVCRWYGGELLRVYQVMGRGQKAKAEVRLRLLGQSLDTWTRLFKLATDTSELTDLRRELDELRELVNAERGGPRGVVRGQA